MLNLKELALVHVLMCVTFIVSGLFINLVQFILFLLLSKVSKSLYRTLNYYLVYSIYSQLLFLAEWWSASTLKIYCHPDLAQVFTGLSNEHAVVLMNHHNELDWLYGWMVADRAKLLGNGRVYAKKMLQYVPVLGWCFRLSDVIFLERNWEKDKDNLAVKLNELLDYPSPVWVLLYPEGTRLSPEKLAASQEFAASRNLPILNHHLVPRTKGFSFTVSRLDPERISSLYDVTLVADQKTPPTLTSILFGRSTVASMYIRKFNLKDIPKDEAGSAAWLMNLFQEKDSLKESFDETGCFAEKSGFPKYGTISHQRRLPSLLITSIASACVVLPMLYFLVFGAVYVRVTLLVVLVLAWLAMDRLINITKISKSSAYGNSAETKKSL